MVSRPSYRRLLGAPRDQSFFLFGLRGVGKSTWSRQALPDAHRIDLLDEGLYQAYLRDPGLFAGELRTLPRNATVIVDEIQRLPALLNEVHRFIEEQRLRFVLLGSSARKLKQAGTNLLAGRAVQRQMLPLVPEELGRDFDLGRILQSGSLPLIWNAADQREALEAYVQLYLKQEIQAEALVRNLPGFARFLPVAGVFHGQVLSVAGLARDAGVARTTVEGYLEILADTHVAWLLPAFDARLRVKERRHPKLYWTDSGMVRAVRREFHPPSAVERGPLFEGWIGQLLRAYGEPASGCREPFDGLSYWAPTEGGIEVDFIVKTGRKFVAIEAKAKPSLGPADLKGLRAIAELPGLKRRIVVYEGIRPQRTEDGIDVLPVKAFIDALQAGTVW
ncbi:ATP-binding protein [bacterium]|nr:ATP-binding protein [bacterium]